MATLDRKVSREAENNRHASGYVGGGILVIESACRSHRPSSRAPTSPGGSDIPGLARPAQTVLRKDYTTLSHRPCFAVPYRICHGVTGHPDSQMFHVLECASEPKVS